jgi:hypothetical protein
MSRFRPKQNGQFSSGYATYPDFCKSFVDDLQLLYLLAFLLTGSQTEAEQCFVATVEDAVREDCVFKGWEHVWIKRFLIVNAIRRVFPGPTESIGKQPVRYDAEVESRGRCTINAVAALAPPIQRFVFVMSVLERYSVHDALFCLAARHEMCLRRESTHCGSFQASIPH